MERGGLEITIRGQQPGRQRNTSRHFWLGQHNTRGKVRVLVNSGTRKKKGKTGRTLNAPTLKLSVFQRFTLYIIIADL